MPDLPSLLQILSRTPAALSALLRGLPDPWSHSAYGPGTWCPYQVVGHLIVAERKDWLPRLRRILDHGESRPFDPFPHDAAIAPDSGIPLDALLDEFQELRTGNLAALSALNLTPADLARTGQHPALGRVTAGQLLSTWTAHDLHHLRQIALGLAWRLRDDVGPWRAYLNTFAR